MPTDWEMVQAVVLYGCWGAFGLVWLIGAVVNLRRAPSVRRRGPQWVSGLVVVLAYVVLRWVLPRSWWSLISYRAPWLGLAGAAVLVAATGFALWARWVLGLMWTSAPVVKSGHQLHTDGPYRLVRHPIYTGLLGMLVGTALVGGLGLWLAVVVVGALVVQAKLRAEERPLTEEFPEQYPQFRQRVPALVPFARLRGPS